MGNKVKAVGKELQHVQKAMDGTLMAVLKPKRILIASIKPVTHFYDVFVKPTFDKIKTLIIDTIMGLPIIGQLIQFVSDAADRIVTWAMEMSGINAVLDKL